MDKRQRERPDREPKHRQTDRPAQGQGEDFLHSLQRRQADNHSDCDRR